MAPREGLAPDEGEDGARGADGTSLSDEELVADAEREHAQHGPSDRQRRGKPSPEGTGRSGIGQAVADGRGHGGREAEQGERDRERLPDGEVSLRTGSV
ncbi:hypothetical protein DL768_007082 [Monosporascus sp. mg162]|nr:hypothetical protein DL768_007082 [Monosporascus sp. mg162]